MLISLKNGAYVVILRRPINNKTHHFFFESINSKQTVSSKSSKCLIILAMIPFLTILSFLLHVCFYFYGMEEIGIHLYETWNLGRKGQLLFHL